MTVNEKKVFNELILETIWQDYLVKELNRRWVEGKNSILNLYLHGPEHHTSQGSSACIQYGHIATSVNGPWGWISRGGKDFPRDQYNEMENIKNGMNGLEFKKTNNINFIKYNNGICDEYLSVGVVCSGDNRVEKDFVLESIQVIYREDIGKYILVMKYDSSLRGENEKIVGKVVRSADDIIENVCEGEGGLIDFIITGYLGMDLYSSNIQDNREIVNGVYVSRRTWWLDGWYYGGYWYGKFITYDYFPYKSPNTPHYWVEDLN